MSQLTFVPEDVYFLDKYREFEEKLPANRKLSWIYQQKHLRIPLLWSYIGITCKYCQLKTEEVFERTKTGYKQILYIRYVPHIDCSKCLERMVYFMDDFSIYGTLLCEPIRKENKLKYYNKYHMNEYCALKLEAEKIFASIETIASVKKQTMMYYDKDTLRNILLFRNRYQKLRVLGLLNPYLLLEDKQDHIRNNILVLKTICQFGDTLELDTLKNIMLDCNITKSNTKLRSIMTLWSDGRCIYAGHRIIYCRYLAVQEARLY